MKPDYPNQLVNSVRRRVGWSNLLVWFVIIPGISCGLWYGLYKLITYIF